MNMKKNNAKVKQSQMANKTEAKQRLQAMLEIDRENEKQNNQRQSIERQNKEKQCKEKQCQTNDCIENKLSNMVSNILDINPKNIKIEISENSKNEQQILITTKQDEPKQDEQKQEKAKKDEKMELLEKQLENKHIKIRSNLNQDDRERIEKEIQCKDFLETLNKEKEETLKQLQIEKEKLEKEIKNSKKPENILNIPLDEKIEIIKNNTMTKAKIENNISNIDNNLNSIINDLNKLNDDFLNVKKVEEKTEEVKEEKNENEEKKEEEIKEESIPSKTVSSVGTVSNLAEQQNGDLKDILNVNEVEKDFEDILLERIRNQLGQSSFGGDMSDLVEDYKNIQEKVSSKKAIKSVKHFNSNK